MGGEAKEVDDMQVKNIDMTDKIIFSYFEIAYNTMNTSEQTDSPKCPKYDIKHHYISEFQTKEATIVSPQQSPTDIGLVKQMKLSSGKKKIELTKQT